jgi:hypothetical protein
MCDFLHLCVPFQNFASFVGIRVCFCGATIWLLAWYEFL